LLLIIFVAEKHIGVSQLFRRSLNRLYTLLLLLLRVNTTAISQSTYYLHYLGTANKTLQLKRRGVYYRCWR